MTVSKSKMKMTGIINPERLAYVLKSLNEEELETLELLLDNEASQQIFSSIKELKEGKGFLLSSGDRKAGPYDIVIKIPLVEAILHLGALALQIKAPHEVYHPYSESFNIPMICVRNSGMMFFTVFQTRS